MAQSLEAFEQMTAEWPPRERTPLRVFASEFPTLRLPIVLKLNKIAAGFSLPLLGDPESSVRRYHQLRGHRRCRR